MSLFAIPFIFFLFIHERLFSQPFEREYRAIQLMDGRVVKGEVLMVEKDGIHLRTREEDVFVPFVNIMEIRTISEGEYLGSLKPRIVVLNFTSPLEYSREALYLTELFLKQLKDVPTIETISHKDFYNMLPVEDKIDFEKCSHNVECIAQIGKKMNVEKILSAEYIPEGESRRLYLNLIHPKLGRVGKRVNLRFTQLPGSFDPFFKTTLYELLEITRKEVKQEIPAGTSGIWGVEKVEEKEKSAIDESTKMAEGKVSPSPFSSKVVTKPETPLEKVGDKEIPVVTIEKKRGRYSREVLVGVGFLPFPGISSLLERDYLCFTLNWLTVFFATSALVYGSGYIAPDFTTHMVASGIGYYLMNVSLNQIFTYFIRKDWTISEVIHFSPSITDDEGAIGFGLRIGGHF